MSAKGTAAQKTGEKIRQNAVNYWSATSVHRILSKISTYTGVYQAFKKRYKMSDVIGDRPKEEWVEIQIPQIVSEKQAELILERLDSNRRFAKKRAVRSYMLQ